MKSRIIAILRQHVGRDALISSRGIARRLRLGPSGDREVRRTIAECLADGTFEDLEMPVVAVPGAGYFVARDIEEFQAYRDHLAGLCTEAKRKLASFDRLVADLGLALQKK